MGELDFSDRFLKSFGDGDVVFEEGSNGKHMYVIVSGSVRIVKKTGGGEDVVATLETALAAPSPDDSARKDEHGN